MARVLRQSRRFPERTMKPVTLIEAHPSTITIRPKVVFFQRHLCCAVAQTCSLLYRRVALCQLLRNADALNRSCAVPNAIRRYGRLKICARPKVACFLLFPYLLAAAPAKVKFQQRASTPAVFD